MDANIGMDVIIAARLSRKQSDGQEGIGLDTQDSRSTAFCEHEGHNVVAVVADTQSGTVPPWDRKNLRPWVTDPALMARYQGIVAYKNDRLSRGAWADEIRIRQWAERNGKKLLIVDGPQWPPRDDGDFWSWTAQAKQASKEWEEIRERSGRAQKELRERGKLVGKAPWGYEITGDKYSKTIVPTDIGREYVPQIFARCIAGESLMSIGRWLESENLPSPDGKSHWSTYSVSRIIRNPTYTGRRCEQTRNGHKRTYGKTIMLCDPLVGAGTFRLANEALTSRPKRGPQNTPDRAMLAGALWCLRCDSPMYRLKVYNRDYWYRCHGRIKDGTQRKSCGNMIPLEKLDARVSERMSRSTAHIFETRVTPGIDHTAEIEEIRMEIGDLGKQDLPDDEFDQRMAELRAERDRLNSLPVVLDRVEQIDTGVSYAERWANLSDPERGQWLRKVKVKIYAMKGTQDEVDAIAAKSGMFTEDDAPPEVVDGVAIFIPMTLGFPLAKTTYRGEGE